MKQKLCLEKTWIWALIAMVVISCSCQQQDARTPDDLPRNGLNPTGGGNGTPAAPTDGPITEGVETRCALEREDIELPEGQKRGVLRIQLSAELSQVRIYLRDPGGSIFTRDELDILETGFYAVEVLAADERDCWSDFQITTVDQDVTLKVSFP